MIQPLLVAARLLLAWVFLRAGLDVLRKPEPRAATAAWLIDSLRLWLPFLPADNVLLVRANAVTQIIAGALLGLGQQPRFAALTLAASMVPTTLGGHAFWRHDDPVRRAQNQAHFDKNLAIFGGLLVIGLGAPGERRSRAWH